MVYFVVSQITLYANIFHHLDNALHSSTWHRCRQEICMEATQTNMEDSEGDTERGNFKQEKGSDLPRQNKMLATKRKAASIAWMWFWYEKSDIDQKTVL